MGLSLRVTLALALTIALFAHHGASAQVPSTENGSTMQESSDAAKSDEKPKSSDHGGPFDLKGKWGTGDWGGKRTEWEKQGLKFKITLMNQIMVNAYGGRETKNGHDTAGSYEVNVYLDFEKMGWIEGGSLFIRGKGTWGGDDSDFDKEKVGAFFKTNQDASSEEPIFVDKWHYSQFLFDKKVELRFGRLEPVKDHFDRSNIMGHEDKQFLNRALVRNATIPSSKGLGLWLHYNITDQVFFRAAAIDANSRSRQTNFNTAFHDTDEFRFYSELGWKPSFESAKGPLKGQWRIGTWYDPKDKKKFRNTLGGALAEKYESGDWGFFVGLDQMIWKENDEPKDKQGLSVAARYGHANGEVNRIEDFWAVAVQYEGLLPERDKDVLGFGVAQGIFADEYRRVRPTADRETVYELYYAIRVAPWLIISPDLQYITNAGGDKDDGDAMVAGLRVKMSL